MLLWAGPETAALTPVIFGRRTESVSCQTDSETVLLVASARFFSLFACAAIDGN